MTELSGPEKRAKSRLGTDQVTPETEFLAEVLEIDQAAIELRHRVAEISLGLSGIRARKQLSELEEEYVDLHDDLIQAHKATLSGKPYLFERVEQGFANRENQFFDNEKKYINQINISFEELERTGTLLTAKQSEAVGRMSVVVSAGAVAVSSLAVVTSVLLP